MSGLTYQEEDAAHSPSRIAIVEDDEDLRLFLERTLRALGHSPVAFSGGQQALTGLATYEFDTLVTDLKMPGMDGFELCARVKAAHPNLGLVLVSAFGDMDCAIEAMRLGIGDFVEKPIDLSRLESAIQRAKRRAEAQIRRLPMDTAEGSFHRIVGSSPAIQEMVRQLRRFAASDSTVLITGESGTGKELVARSLHEHSARREKPFVGINCSAIPSELLESEFFGHEAGSFTGASAGRAGLIAAAEGGVLFLDEIGAMPLALQAKLLRALQERVVRPVGSKAERPFDVRVIAAANQDLERLVEQRAFRRDLLFRLDVVRVELPPLRDRGADVLDLAAHFLSTLTSREGASLPPELTEEAKECLLRYAWPGNVRELQNCIEAAITLTGDKRSISPRELPARVRNGQKIRVEQASDPDGLLPLELVERDHILNVMRAVHGNKAAAARILGINRVTLYRKLAQTISTKH